VDKDAGTDLDSADTKDPEKVDDSQQPESKQDAHDANTADNQDSVERLIICNELSQIQLNHIYRIILASMANSTLAQAEVAKTLYRSFRNRANLVDEMFGANASDTRVFCQAVFDSGISTHQNLRMVLQNVRYLPARHSFHREWKIWRTQLRQAINPEIKIVF
jgi:hypothetical protein